MPNPISRTAYYTLGVRAADAARQRPILGDTYAERLMNDEARAVWAEFASFRPANASNAARHAIIDTYLARELAADPQGTVVIVGAGFDARAFRLTGGRWFELDEPEILNYKESRLPAATAPNPLQRIAIEFAREPLAGKLAAITAPTSVHIIVEGVLMYLTREQRLSLLGALAERFPHHTLYCDLMRKNFFEKYSRDIHEKIVGMGATFTDLEQQPERLFTSNGYTMIAQESVTMHAIERADVGIPAWAARYFLRTMREGYLIAVFRR